MNNISIFVTVYNEEERIVDFLRSFSWSDDIILLDKSSTDRTVELAKPFNPTIVSIPYSDQTASDSTKCIALAKNEWVMMVTASDVIHPKLAKRLLEAVNRPDFEYDVITMPYSIYVFGIKDARSPWYSTRENKLARKSVISLSDRVHEERGTTSNRVFNIEGPEGEALLHLTHRNIETFFEHHLRYCRLEANKYTDESGVKKSFKEIIEACKLVFLRKKSFRMGEDGRALGLAYISYFIMKYLYVWQKFHGKGESEYKRIRAEFLGDGESCVK